MSHLTIILLAVCFGGALISCAWMAVLAARRDNGPTNFDRTLRPFMVTVGFVALGAAVMLTDALVYAWHRS